MGPSAGRRGRRQAGGAAVRRDGGAFCAAPSGQAARSEGAGGAPISAGPGRRGRADGTSRGLSGRPNSQWEVTGRSGPRAAGVAGGGRKCVRRRGAYGRLGAVGFYRPFAFSSCFARLPAPSLCVRLLLPSCRAALRLPRSVPVASARRRAAEGKGGGGGERSEEEVARPPPPHAAAPSRRQPGHLHGRAWAELRLPAPPGLRRRAAAGRVARRSLPSASSPPWGCCLAQVPGRAGARGGAGRGGHRGRGRAFGARARAGAGAGRCGAASAACLGVPFPPRGQRARRARGGAGPAGGEADAALEVVGVKPGSVGLCGGLPEDAGICCVFLLQAEPALAWRVGNWGEGGRYPAHGRCLLKWTVFSTWKLSEQL